MTKVAGSWSSGRRPASRRARICYEVEVALVVPGSKNARSVIHQHEVRDVDRQLPAPVERMHRLDAGVEAELFGFFDRASAVPT